MVQRFGGVYVYVAYQMNVLMLFEIFPAFLKLVEAEGYYQIGKNYYEPLSLIQFDQASQAFLDFLGRMIPDEAKTNLDFILPNNARHLCLPYGFFRGRFETDARFGWL